MVELMPHQKKAVEQLSNGKVLWGGVGSGKSITVLAYYMQKEASKDIYVITTAKKRDTLEWYKDAVSFGISEVREYTSAGIITVDSWNNIGKYIDVEDAFFIFDEQRVVGNGSWVKSFIKIAKKNNWVLLSATPGDTWLDYVPIFIANGFFKNATEFKREHVVYATYTKYPKIVRYLNVKTLEKYRNIVLVEMPYLKHTIREINEIQLPYDEKLFKEVFKKRWNIFTLEPCRDITELLRVLKRIVYTDPSRFDTIVELLDKHPKLIIYYNFNYELEILRRLSNFTTVAEWNGHKKQRIPDTDSWVYLVQYTAGAEGWNCTETDAMIFYSLTYSYKNFEQAQGRIDRLNTPFTILNYYMFLSNSIIDRAVRLSIANKRLFNEVDWAKKSLGLNSDFSTSF